MLASIPSPGRNVIEIGPVDLRVYGLAIAAGVLASVWITQRRWAARGGDPDAISRIAMWGVPFGVVGARLYHVATDWKRFRGDWWSVVEIWEGGLGIWGGIGLGTVGGLIAARRMRLRPGPLLDAAAPALPVAQALGRLGNWFNQELFGRPTDLPWGLEIDPSHRPDRYADVATFHPTFLYEILWNLALALLLAWLGPRLARRWRPGALFALYVAGYTVGRLWIELVRIDPASELLGQRINVWTSLLLMAAALGAFAWLRRSPADADGDPAEVVDTSTPA